MTMDDRQIASIVQSLPAEFRPVGIEDRDELLRHLFDAVLYALDLCDTNHEREFRRSQLRFLKGEN